MADVVCVVRGYWDVNVELLIANMLQWDLVGYNLICRCVVCGQGILRCICRIVNWKYVTVGVGWL